MSPLVSEVPRRALKFSANDLFKSYLRGENGGEVHARRVLVVSRGIRYLLVGQPMTNSVILMMRE